nr:disease resistance protein RGA2-like isoform X2 [Quercus suber]
MAETLLIDLFKQLGSIAVQLAKQEINLLVGVDEEVQKLQDRLGFIKAMLDDAEERHAVKQRTKKLWLEQLQNQYYEMDDILDTWNAARIRAEIEKKEGKPADTNAPAVAKKKLVEERYQRGTRENWHEISHISNIRLGGVYVQRDGEPWFDSKFDDDQHN